MLKEIYGMLYAYRYFLIWQTQQINNPKYFHRWVRFQPFQMVGFINMHAFMYQYICTMHASKHMNI